MIQKHTACRNFSYKIHILFLVCLLTRLCFTGRHLDSCDSIDFALGLHDYDLSLFQPHFPGYPVYLFTSRLFFKLFRSDVWALVMPGVLFGSLTIYPLFLLSRQLFSERVAVLTAILYLSNPLCWLQAERPTSDAMGLFFVILSAYFLHHAFTGRYTYSLICGSVCFGFGLGVRLSYFPFIALWAASLCSHAMQGRPFQMRIILYGVIGLITGICMWLFPQIGYTGWHFFWQNGISFLYGHFTDWGGSVITFGGPERIVRLVKSIWVYGLGGWWFDYSFLRLIPLFIIISSFCFFKRHHLGRQWWFLGVYLIPYTLWIILGQNVTNPRHVLPVIPVILMLIAYGLCKVYEEGNKAVFVFFLSVFVIVMSAISLKSVIHYRNTIPAPIRLIQFIEGRFDSAYTRIYCSEEKRFFDYYAPLWDVRHARDAAGLNIDLLSSLNKPQNILLIHTPWETEKFSIGRLLNTFQGNPYTDGRRDALLLHTVTLCNNYKF